jgi:hypothetical protein
VDFEDFDAWRLSRSTKESARISPGDFSEFQEGQ